MAGNTRGKLKEQFGGVHNNFDWALRHCVIAVALIKEHNPKLSKAVKALVTGIETLDELAQDIYSKL